jgi:hypothetical protein
MEYSSACVGGGEVVGRHISSDDGAEGKGGGG